WSKSGDPPPPPFFCYKPNCKYYSNICPLNYSPMCGTNEITYSNECMLYSAIKFKYALLLISINPRCGLYAVAHG
uniref:Si:dkey-203a12.9 n=1 Tax=Cyprinus carpio TaxID=7962 RepID=A0A8C1YP00_CYPCA